MKYTNRCKRSLVIPSISYFIPFPVFFHLKSSSFPYQFQSYSFEGYFGILYILTSSSIVRPYFFHFAVFLPSIYPLFYSLIAFHISFVRSLLVFHISFVRSLLVFHISFVRSLLAFYISFTSQPSCFLHLLHFAVFLPSVSASLRNLLAFYTSSILQSSCLPYSPYLNISICSVSFSNSS